MNILNIGDLAFTPLPAELAKDRMPKLDPELLTREHDENGVQYMFVMRRRRNLLYKVPIEEWRLLELFDGRRSYEQIALEYSQRTGVEYTPEQIREYAELRMKQGAELFYQSPMEKNQARLDTVLSRRRHRKHIDLAEIPLLYFDPHRYLTWMHEKLGFVFKPWFTVATLVLWTWMFYEWIVHFGEIWNDSLNIYNFTDKSAWDIAEFWILFLVIAVIHETAHGLACTHWGGESHQMGFMLMWMTPAFFCDCTEIHVYGNRWQRIGVAFAGMWSELLVCVLATAIWLGTAPGMLIHELAYKLILVGGIFIIILNLNPLIKLDGYYIFTDLIRFPDLKEDATSYLSNRMRRLFRLPHSLPAIPLRRKVFYVTYAVLSGIYSYLLLIFFAELGYNISRHFWPEWSLLPAAAIAFVLFKSRLKRFVEFMKTVYLDKKERWRAWLRQPAHGLPVGVAVLALVFAPVWRETVDGTFVLESPARAVVRAEVPGKVVSIAVNEGEQVAAGQPLARLSDLRLESSAARARADYENASAHAFAAQLKYASLSATQNELARSEQQQRMLADREAKLHVVSPIAGTVISPRPQDLLGSYVKAGATLVEVAETSRLRARIYLPDAYMHDVSVGRPVSLRIDGWVSALHGRVDAITQAANDMPKELSQSPRYEGLGTTVFYSAWVDFTNPGTLRPGMTGDAKILVTRRSLAGFAWRGLADAFDRRVW